MSNSRASFPKASLLSTFWHRPYFGEVFQVFSFGCLRGSSLNISPVVRSISEDLNRGCLPHSFVTVTCSSAWTDIPDVRFENAPLIHLDPGGSGTDKHHRDLFEDLTLLELGNDVTSLTFSFKDGDHVINEWDAILIHNDLFIQVPQTSLPPGIKEGFVSLLDYAEESLQVTKVTICIPKAIPSRAEILRAFMFIGFRIVNPDQLQYINHKKDHVFMEYKLT